MTTAQISETRALALADLRAEFALRLASLYGTEVPAYNTLVDVSREVNADFIAAHGADAERLGSIDRVTAERHGAIRVGSPRELAQAARVFAGFGMYPVGFYDLRDASKSSVPVVSTAFRPVDADELAKNPFRVFTSMLVATDRRFFDAETQARLEEFIGARTLFGPELLELADRSADQGGLDAADADRFLDLATAAFELSTEPVDHDWYFALERISAVAADIGGVPSTHINHLTPRVLDIDDLYERMEARGITMIDEIQGPPDWEGPDVLLRQTSFKALAEERQFRHADGSVRPGSLRVRFGEVEQRGVALTAGGATSTTGWSPRSMSASPRHRPAPPGSMWPARSGGRTCRAPSGSWPCRDWRSSPTGWRPTAAFRPAPCAALRELVEAGVLVPEPIVYEDFLPRSAAGIFQSNLTDEGTRDDDLLGTPYDIDTLSEVIGRPIADPTLLYEAQQSASLAAAARAARPGRASPPNWRMHS